MAYLNVDEIESAINSLANEYQDTCQAITLPNQTKEGRTCKALNVGRGLVDVNKPAILFTGAVQARELLSDTIYTFIFN